MATMDFILKWIGVLTVMYWVGVFLKYLLRNYTNSWRWNKKEK
jgi:hypothetical protein